MMRAEDLDFFGVNHQGEVRLALPDAGVFTRGPAEQFNGEPVDAPPYVAVTPYGRPPDHDASVSLTRVLVCNPDGSAIWPRGVLASSSLEVPREWLRTIGEACIKAADAAGL
jgi:hypothetical protein